MNTAKTELQSFPFLFNLGKKYIREKKDELKLMMKSKASLITSVMSMGRRSIYTLLAVFIVYSIFRYKEGMF